MSNYLQKGLIEVEDLTVRLSNGFVAVDSVSFGIERGEILALVGESGCGKTLTALSLLNGVPPDVGASSASRLELDGCELTGLDGGHLRAVRGGRISMIFQDASAALDPLFTIGSQIVETICAHNRNISGSAARQHALSVLEDVELKEPDSFFARYPHELSGGQRQRAMIAMALSTGPELLIADEPTTALDVTVQRQVLDLLASLSRERGLALLLITHNLALVASLAGRVLIMYAGQIVESAAVEDFFRFRDAAHPYSRALLECIPRLDEKQREPATIPGNVPSPGNWPTGCRFRERCRFACQGCERQQHLAPVAGRPYRAVRCLLAGKRE
ncbi:MAG: ABC transporter ATP-binding protein [Gemmatimonadota bacterium]|nr:ABC transporter ATP-binding protein [Gemmatimonadota bacterium]